MRRVFLVVDLSFLRGPNRDTHLANLLSAVARTWATYFQPDISFGYKLFDSSCGDCAVNHYLQRVASELRLPQRLHAPTGTDLSSEDLPLLMSLIDKATDDEFLQSRNLRGRRTSRSAEIPAQGLVRALQTAVSSSYLQKLAADKTDSASGEKGAEGVLLAFTPAVADEVSAKLFVGSDAYITAGSLHAAIAQQLPAKLVTTASALSLRFCWLSADEINSVDQVPDFTPLKESVRSLFKIATAVLPAAVAALPSLDRPVFASQLSLPYEPEEEASDTTTAIEELWPTDDASLDTLKVLVSSLERPYAGRATDEGKRKLKVARTNKNLSKKITRAEGSADPVADGMVGKTGRGQRLREKALLKQRTEVSARSGGAGQLAQADSLPAVDAAAAAPAGGGRNTGVATEIEAAEPLTMEHAIKKVSTGLESIVERLLKEGPSPPQPATAAKFLAESVQKLVSTVFSGVLTHESATCEDLNDALNLGDIRIALGSRAVTPAAEFKAQHAARVPYEKQVAFTWTCAAQVLLRMAIVAHGTATTGIEASATASTQGRLDSAMYTEILSLLQIVVATMQPIPSGGQTFFREGVKPRFGSGILAADIRRLESTLWEDEDSDNVDTDGGIAALRTKAASLEASGETPEAPGNKVAGVSHGEERTNKPAGAGGAVAGRGPLAALPPRARQNGRNGYQSQPTGSVGNGSHSVRSADGSGVNGSVSAATAGATAATRNAGKLTDAEFLSRRYANSKQYSMQMRVGGAAQNSRAKQIAAVAAGGIMSHQAAPTSKFTRPGGGAGGGGGKAAAVGGGAGHLHQSSKGERVPVPGNRGAPAAGTHRAASPRRKERLPRAVPDTPQGNQQGNNNPTISGAAAAGAAAADGDKNKRTAGAAPRQLFSQGTHPIVPATLEAIPNTTPREIRAAARTGPGIGASPLRQNLFGIPGAIIPTQDEREDVDDMVNPTGGLTAAAAAAAPAARATWFTGAVVPKGNVGRPAQQQQQQVAAAVVAMPVAEATAEPAPAVEEKMEVEDKEVQAVEEPAVAAAVIPTGVATRRRSTAAAAAIASAEEKEKADANPREQRRKTRASAAAEEVVIEPVKSVAALQKKGGKAKKTAAAAGAVQVAAAAPPAPVAEEAPAPVAVEEENKPRKRTRSTTATAIEEPAASQHVAPAPSKRRASSRLQQTSKSVAAAPTTTRTTTRAAAKKNGQPEVASPPAAPDAIAPPPAAEAATAEPEVPVPESPAVPAELDFQTIMAAAVVVNDTAELAQVADVAPASPAEPEPAEEPEEAAPAAAAAVAMPPPPPPVLAPEAVPPPPPPAPLFSPPALMATGLSPPMVTPVTAAAPTPSHARTASVLGKRSLAGLTGRTPATKRGRLGNMLAVGAKPSARSLPKPAEISPPRHEIQDIGSPAKPSPYADDFALPANSPGRKGKKKGATGAAVAAARGNNKNGTSRPPRGGFKNPNVVKKMDLSLRRVAAVTGAEPADSSAGESIGDAPALDEEVATAAATATKKTRLTSMLKPLSPIQHQDEADSDAEDEAMLQAAANGDLSPPPGSFDDEEEDEQEDAAANASVLETTPPAENEAEGEDEEGDEVVATGPRSGRQAKAAAAPKTKKTATKRASRSVWTKTKKKKRTTKPANKQQQLRMSKLAARQEKATGVEGVPSIGDDIKCIMPTSTGQAVTIHCQIVKIESTEKDRRGGWVCKAEVQPITNEEFAVLSFMVQLHSAQLRAWDAELLNAGEWSHMQALDASPIVAHQGGGAGAGAGGGKYMAPAETARHNAAARNQQRDSLDSVPVLPETAQKLRLEAKAGADEFVSPRNMRPVHLNMDKAADAVCGGGVGRNTLPAAMAAVVTSAMKAARRDSISSGGTVNNSYGLRQGMVSPAAHAAAMGMLGALYRGGTPQPAQNVEEELQAAMSPQSQWAAMPGAAMA